jgi:hypothetical protein
MEFYVFALLPLGLLSLFERGRHRATAGLGFLAALAPVLAKGALSLIKGKQNKSKEKQAEEARRLEAQRADTEARSRWEEEMNSPGAQQSRFKNTFTLGRLAGAMKGLANVPPSIAKHYQSLRAMPEYKGQSSYIPTPKKGGTGWDIAGGIADALGYLDTSKFGKPKLPAATGFGTGSSFTAPPAAAPMSTTPLVDLIKRQKDIGGLANPVYPPKG